MPQALRVFGALMIVALAVVCVVIELLIIHEWIWPFG